MVAPAALTKLCASCGYRLEAHLQRCPIDGSKLGRERPEVAVVGSYRLVERLGTGGMGVVYRAIHEKLGRTVAIKMLHRSMASDQVNLARFFQEARSVNKIRHPNVVDIYDFVSAGGEVYMVMEFLVGHDLYNALYAGGGRPFPVERAVHILEQMCAALDAAHVRNIIHRDLKPANVFLTRRQPELEFVKLLDFGLAKLDRSDGRMTRDGVVLGTPEYMAPEQARGEPLDGRTDLYAVGCIAYHMLTGCQLFAGGHYADVMLRHVKETPPPPRDLNPTLPPEVEAVVLRALAKRPDDRPATAGRLIRELREAIGRPIEESVPAPSNTTGAPPSPMSLPGLPPVSTSRPELGALGSAPRRSRRIVPLAVVGCFLGLAGLAALLWPGRTQRHPTPAAAPPPVTPVQPQLQRLVAVKLQSSPPGAVVTSADGVRIGETPTTLNVPPGSDHEITFTLAGHRPERRPVRAENDHTVAVVLKPIITQSDNPPAKAQKATAPPDRARRDPPPPAPPPALPDPGAPAELDSKARTINPFPR